MSSTPATGGDQHKTVIGFPSQSSQVAAGYPVAGTAYPYAAPPPSSSQLYSRPLGPAATRTGSSFLCRMVMAAAAMFAILGAVFFVTWFALRPHLPQFRLTSASVSPLNMTRSELSATWNLTLLVRNPNSKLLIYYDHVHASLVYGDDSVVGTAQLAPFFQGKKNETLIQIEFSVLNDYVGEDVVTKISGERANGTVGFRFRVFSWVTFRAGSWWRSRQCWLRVYCDRVQIGFDANKGSGSLTGQTGNCEVNL